MPTIEVFETVRQPTAASTANPSGLYARQRFEAGLQCLKSPGVQVQRHAISLDGLLAFDNGTVKTAIELQGEDSLPMVAFDGTIISIDGYPTHTELLTAAGYRPSDNPEFLREASALAAGVSEGLLINDLAQVRLNYDRARLLGLTADDLRSIIELAKTAGRQTIRDETLAQLERFLAFGPAGKQQAPRCSCGGEC